MTNLELEQFITEYGREIYSFCVSLCGSRQEADDLYQDTFLTALEKIDRIDIVEKPSEKTGMEEENCAGAGTE